MISYKNYVDKRPAKKPYSWAHSWTNVWCRNVTRPYKYFLPYLQTYQKSNSMIISNLCIKLFKLIWWCWSFFVESLTKWNTLPIALEPYCVQFWCLLNVLSHFGQILSMVETAMTYLVKDRHAQTGPHISRLVTPRWIVSHQYCVWMCRFNCKPTNYVKKFVTR